MSMDLPGLAIHIDGAEIRTREAPEGVCPNDGTRLETGYGLAGGGYGVYDYCPECFEAFNKAALEDGQ